LQDARGSGDAGTGAETAGTADRLSQKRVNLPTSTPTEHPLASNSHGAAEFQKPKKYLWIDGMGAVCNYETSRDRLVGACIHMEFLPALTVSQRGMCMAIYSLRSTGQAGRCSSLFEKPVGCCTPVGHFYHTDGCSSQPLETGISPEHDTQEHHQSCHCQFQSHSVFAPDCCAKKKKNWNLRYYYSSTPYVIVR
jgi:hypothetical protein